MSPEWKEHFEKLNISIWVPSILVKSPKDCLLSKYGDMRLGIFNARDMNAFLVWNNLKSSPKFTDVRDCFEKNGPNSL